MRPPRRALRPLPRGRPRPPARPWQRRRPSRRRELDRRAPRLQPPAGARGALRDPHVQPHGLRPCHALPAARGRDSARVRGPPPGRSPRPLSPPARPPAAARRRPPLLRRRLPARCPARLRDAERAARRAPRDPHRRDRGSAVPRRRGGAARWGAPCPGAGIARSRVREGDRVDRRRARRGRRRRRRPRSRGAIRACRDPGRRQPARERRPCQSRPDEPRRARATRGARPPRRRRTSRRPPRDRPPPPPSSDGLDGGARTSLQAGPLESCRVPKIPPVAGAFRAWPAVSCHLQVF